jgi:hypothetical protein
VGRFPTGEPKLDDKTALRLTGRAARLLPISAITDDEIGGGRISPDLRPRCTCWSATSALFWRRASKAVRNRFREMTAMKPAGQGSVAFARAQEKGIYERS